MILAMESVTALWLVVILGGVLNVSLIGAFLMRRKEGVSREEVHTELQKVEKKMAQEFDKVESKMAQEFREVDERFESERKTAREANERIYNRLNDCAKGVTRVETRFEGMDSRFEAFENMLTKLVERQMQG